MTSKKIGVYEIQFACKLLKLVSDSTSRKLAYITLTPFKPHFYIVKLGFGGVYIIFLIPAQNIDCGYSL